MLILPQLSSSTIKTFPSFKGAVNLSDANWGAYDRNDFGIAFSLKPATGASGQRILSKFDGGESELNIIYSSASSTLNIEIRFATGAGGSTALSATSININTWYAVYVRNTAANGLQLYVNNVLVDSDASNPTTYNNTGDIYWLETAAASTLINQPSFFSGTVPLANEVYAVSNKLRNLSGMSGLYSQLKCEGNDPTFDSVKSINWGGTPTIELNDRP